MRKPPKCPACGRKMNMVEYFSDWFWCTCALFAGHRKSRPQVEAARKQLAGIRRKARRGGGK